MKNLLFKTVLLMLVCTVFQANAQTGRTLDLDGVDDYMLIPSHDDFNVSESEDFTITFFAKANTLAGTPRVVYKRDMIQWDGPAYDFYMNGTSGYALNLRESTKVNLGTTVTATLTAERWYHYAIILSRAAGTVTIYRNGLLEKTITNNVLKTNSISNMYSVVVGAMYDSRETSPYSSFFFGSVDNLRFWKKSLTLKEITDDFTAPVVSGQPGLVAAYDFQNIENNIVPDISGRGHNGTLHGKTAGGGTGGSVTYCTPAFSTANDNVNSVANRYVGTATTTGATTNISYSATTSSDTRYVNYTAESISVSRNQFFTLRLLSAGNGATNLTDGMQYTQTDLYADWNGDGVFADTELVQHTGNNNASSNGQCDLSFNVTVPSDAVGGDTRLRVRYYDAWTTNSPAPTSCSAGNKSFSIDFAMHINAPLSAPIITASNLLQNKLWAGQGNKNEAIVRAAITVTGTGDPLVLSSVSINMEGTSDKTDVSKIKVYIADDASEEFDVLRSTLFGEATPTDGTINITGNAELSAGVNYLWVTYDLYVTAVEGNQLDASVLSLGLGDGGETYTLPVTTVDGNRTILLEHTHVLKENTAGSLHYRIPAIVTALDGSLVAAADKRWDALNDLPGHLDVIITRSTDNGKTWSAPITIAGANTNVGYGDPALVVDKVENPGTILCIFASGAAFWGSTQANPISVNVSKSTDNGLTWTAPVDITNQVWGNASNINGTYGAFAASGRALQLKDGRIMFVIDARNTSAWGGTTLNYAVYSDDGGNTWTTSPNSPTPSSTNNTATANGDESKVVELANGNILMSMRNRNNDGMRLFSISTDRGLNWTQRANWGDFAATNCNGDVIYYTYKADGYASNRMLHSIPNHASIRQNVSVKLTYDEGSKWVHTKSICQDYSAYSSLTILPDNTIGIFYEKGKWDASLPGDDYFELYFARFSLNWLTDGADTELDKLHTVSWSQVGDGSVSIVTNPNKSEVRNGGRLREGTSLTLNITPDPLNGIESVMLNGENITALLTGGKYDFSANETKNIVVTFKDLTTGCCSIVEKKTALKVFPNPATNYVRIESGDESVSVVVVDLAGRKLFSKTVDGDAALNLKSFAAGVYMLQVKRADGAVENFRLIKK